MSNPWYAFYPGDYGRDTAHLSLVEDGAYRRLLDYYYSAGRPIPTHVEQVFRICRAFAPAEQDAVRTVLQQFFVQESEGWHNRRVDRELDKAREISEKRSKAGKESGWKRRNKWSTSVQHLPAQPQSQPHTQPHTQPQEQGGAASPQIAPSKPVSGDVPSGTSEAVSEESATPEGLTQVEYARRLLDDLGLPATGNLLLVADAISADAKKHGITKAESFELIRRHALSDKDADIEINRFYWTDGKFRTKAGRNGNSRAQQRQTDTINAVEEAKRIMAARAARVASGASG